ncbi:hypothetical protein niasHT_024653 [Heterodera trifolii]|uniref:Uncharacterized protein n=1 Tax=Heterodera trifolii TaxID=157864 RepID=A0ABD2K7L9_9BILA
MKIQWITLFVLSTTISAIFCASSVKLPRAIAGPSNSYVKRPNYAQQQAVQKQQQNGMPSSSGRVQTSFGPKITFANGTVFTSVSDQGVEASVQTSESGTASSSTNVAAPSSSSSVAADAGTSESGTASSSTNIVAPAPSSSSSAADGADTASNTTSTTPTSSSSNNNSSVEAEQQQPTPIEQLQTVNCDGPPLPCILAGRKDFNPKLNGGDPNQPGIKARLNAEAFRYLSGELVGILNYQVKRAKLKDIDQCIPKAGGCLRINHLHVNRYKCSKDVFFKPSQPNRLIMDVRNIDLDVNGDLGGQITIMHPLALFGQVQVTAQNVKVVIGVVVENSATNEAKLRVVSCSSRFGRIDTSIQYGGLLGDIANQQLKQKINKVVRRQITTQLCKRVPQMVDEQVNPQIAGVVPKKIAFKSISSVALNSSCLAALTGDGGANKTTTISTTTTTTTTTTTSTLSGNSTDASETTTETTTKAPSKKAPSPISLIMQLMDMKKLDKLFLSSQLTGSSATDNDYTLSLKGDFSLCGWGCTPFSPVPVEIPPCIGKGCKMADIVLNEYTINSMLYHMHRIGFFVIKVGPDTPAVGRLMRLTCESGDEDENGTLIFSRRRSRMSRRRTKRQEEEEEDLVQTMIDTGICIRSLLPAAADEYPDEKVDLTMSTMRAPSVTIYKNSTIILEHIAKLEFYGHTNKKKLGTFKATSVAQIDVKTEGDLIKANLTLPTLVLTDIGTDIKSGMTQDGLDSLTGLVKDKVPESANKKLAKGCKLDLPPGVGGLPIRILKPEVNFVAHAVHLKSNFELYSTDGSSPLGASEPCE